MIATALRRRPLAAVLASAVLVVGCADSPKPRLFTLAAQPGSQYGAYSGTITVKPVDFPKYLDRPQLVRHSDPYELNTSEFERWGEGVGDMVTRVLVADLAMRLPRGQIVASGSLTVTSETTLEVNIGRFDAEPAGSVVLSAQWVVQPSRGKARLRSAEIRVDRPVGSATELAASMSEALGQLSDRITASIVQ